MTTTDWIIDIALVLLVVRQLREERFTWKTLLLPLAGVTYAAHSYLHSIPTAGNDLVLVGLLMAAGAALGLVGGAATRVRAKADGKVTIQASALSAALWIGSTGTRLGFIIWTTHGGAASLTRFSTSHHITSADAWSAALILMVLTEVALRMGLITARVLRARRSAPVTPATPAADRVLVSTH